MTEKLDVQSSNAVTKVVEDFGLEWSRFDQSGLARDEAFRYFEEYFSIFPWSALPVDAQGFDLGCGSGRWARFVAERVGFLNCIDASSDALQVAKKTLAHNANVEFHHASVDSIPLADNSMDFGYSLGVLHHVPDTGQGLASCVQKLKTGAPMLVYLYYAFDDRPFWFRIIWKISDVFRYVISRMPNKLKFLATDFMALFVYWPLARTAWLCEKMGFNVASFPLSYYRNRSFYTMRTDALDRFGTSLEQRFTRPEIQQLMENAGLERIAFRDGEPYWCALGYKK